MIEVQKQPPEVLMKKEFLKISQSSQKTSGRLFLEVFNKIFDNGWKLLIPL